MEEFFAFRSLLSASERRITVPSQRGTEGYKTVWHVMSLSFDDPQLSAGAVLLYGVDCVFLLLSVSEFHSETVNLLYLYCVLHY